MLAKHASAYLPLESFQLALEDYNASTAYQEQSSDYRILASVAKCHLRPGNPSAALQNALAALAVAPMDGQAITVKVYAERMQGFLDQRQTAWRTKDWESAESALQGAMKECPGVVPLQWRLWAIDHGLMGKNWSAVEVLAR